ncbi:MAG: AMP-binding protein [Pseudomonas sp.]|uniref:AMP-binding protein n=1 Tax=unclassified Pseudomonas TaxID=196821 RepID=UPI000AB35B45|nr:AMP-binding protein [Pseudomonas sp. L5B5]UCZ85048.1 AMP-binding protein [Pseudomonas sp. L5B5]
MHRYESLRHWARVRPLHNALRHKRQGHWYGWRWIDVLRDVERLADSLRQHGLDHRSRLVLSGPFEPDLLLLALAAQSLGAEVASIDDQLPPDGLRQCLWRLRPSHVLVDTSQQLQDWLAASDNGVAPRLLIVRHPGLGPVGLRRSWLAFSELAGSRGGSRCHVHWCRLANAVQLWSEEGTHWQGGLEVLLGQWLGSGHSLAFPESRRSAARDRRQVAPSGLLLSPPRLQRLAEEIEGYLAPRDSWRQRLWAWAASHPHSARARLLEHPMRWHLGFGRLRFVWQPVQSRRPAPAWITRFEREPG